MTPALFARLNQARHAGRSAATVTDLVGGAQALLDQGGIIGPLALSKEATAKAQAMLAVTASGCIEDDGRTLFVRSYGPPWTILVIGAVHITQRLAPMAKLAGFAVTIADPRASFASPSRFPDLTLRVGWPDEVMAADPPGPHTAVVTLTHDPKIDDPALRAALRSQAFYVGALGSSKTHAKRLARLAEEGFTETELARIMAPVGLDLGGRLPGEIAVAILAEVVAARYGRPSSRPR